MKMKKMLLLFIFIISFGLIFTSCNSNQTASKVTTNNIKQYNPSNTDKQSSKDVSTNNLEAKDEFSNIAAFWGDFRNAVINKNFNKIEKAARFPIEIRGPLDSNPIIKLNKDKFDETFSTFLVQDAGINGKETEFDYIKNSEKLDFKNPKDYDKSGNYLKSVRVEANRARIGDMVFELENNSWKLTFIYVDENCYKKLGVDIK